MGMLITGLPIALMVGKKRISLNLNTYRNLHYQISNKAKKVFVTFLKRECGIEGMIDSYPVELIYTIYRRDRRTADIMNVGSVLDKFTSDALVTLGYLPDDNTNYIKKVSFIDGGIDKQNPRAKLEIREL